MDALADQAGSGVARDYWEAMTEGERSEAIEAYAITSYIDGLEAQTAAETSEVERLKGLITDANNKLKKCDQDDKHAIGVVNRELNSLRRSLSKALRVRHEDEPPATSARDASLTDGGQADAAVVDAPSAVTSSVDAHTTDVPSATDTQVAADRASAPRAAARPKPK
eukprot:1712594-Pleurochrysis_carterae.AAC.1